MNKFNYEIREYKDRDKTGVLDLLQHLWKVNNEKIKIAFDWKYDNNPFFGKNYRYVATSGNQIVAFRGFFPNKLRHNNVKFNILSPSDMVVNPNYRRMGIFNSITKFAIKDIEAKADIDFFANFSSNEFSSPGYLKLGWQEIDGSIHLYSNTLTGQFLGKISDRKIYNWSRNFFNFIDRKMVREPKSQIFPLKLEVKKSLKIETTNQIQKMGNRDGLNITQDYHYLHWRLQNPLKNYYLITLKKSNKIYSYVILERKSNGHYFLLDYNYLKLSYLRTLFYRLIKKYNINLVKTWTFPLGFKALSTCNFYHPKFVYKLNNRYRPSNFLIRPVNYKLKSNSWIINGIDIRDRDIWNVCPIVSDGK